MEYTDTKRRNTRTIYMKLQRKHLNNDFKSINSIERYYC